jgi:hypothetical protein
MYAGVRGVRGSPGGVDTFFMTCAENLASADLSGWLDSRADVAGHALTGCRILCACRAGRAELRPALATVTVLSLTLQAFGHLGSVASLGPLAVVASGLLVVRLLRCPVTIDDHAAACGWIAGTIAATSLGRAHEGP